MAGSNRNNKNFGEQASDAYEKVADKAGQAKEYVSEKYDQAKDKTKKQSED
jgi:hypothetical protein